jgi:hypothetical protein
VLVHGTRGRVRGMRIRVSRGGRRSAHRLVRQIGRDRSRLLLTHQETLARSRGGAYLR